MFKIVITILFIGVLSSCSSAEYKYQPVEHQAAQHGKGKSEAVYSEPPGAPEGKVKVVSLGVVDLKSKQDSKSFPALHISVSITNQSTTEQWTLNSQDQFVSFPNDGQTKPLVMDPSLSNVITVEPGGLKTLDYYFPLPNEKMSAANLPEFDFHWKLEAGSNPVEETTSFDRVQIPQYASAYPYGPYYDPWFYPGGYWGWGHPGWRGGGFVIVRPR